MTPPNPLTGANPKQSIMDLVLGGLPAAQQGGAQQNALSAMLGPGTNLTPYLKMGGVGYGEQLDDLMTNPMAAWFSLLAFIPLFLGRFLC